MENKSHGAWWCQETVEGRCECQCVVLDLGYLDDPNHCNECKGTGWIFIPYNKTE